MRVAVSQKYLSLSRRLAKESNKLSRSFSNANYSKIGNIEGLLLKRDVSVEKKKKILINELRNIIIKTFSIDRKKFSSRTLNSLKKRLHCIRKIIDKLRSINYYLETLFLEDLKVSRIRTRNDISKLRDENAVARDELEALEYATYQLIEEVIILDKRLLSEYEKKGKGIVKKEKIEVKDLGLILGKESALLEHLEAKIPPPRAVSMILLKDPRFTNWIARIFALLSCLEHSYAQEALIFGNLKKNKEIKMKISKKIALIVREKSRLARIMEEKVFSMKKFRMDIGFRKELHNLTTAMRL